MRQSMLALCLASAASLIAPAAIAREAGSPAAVAAMANRASAGVTSHAGQRWGQRWGSRMNGRWSAGWNAPGGWQAYRRPVHGWVLPRYWISPSFYIADFRGYGLPAPSYGFGWSRYYDDAVLTDRYGRVIDVRPDYDWDRYGGYDDYYDERDYGDYRDYRDDRRDRRRGRGDAVAGAVAGGLIGGVAGSAIAGRGNRTEGAIIGAGLGAVAGAAIGDSAGRRGRDRRDYDYDRRGGRGYRDDYGYRGGYADDGVSYNGQWVGTWYGADGASYSGTYDGRYDGSAHWQSHGGAAGIPALPYAPIPAYGYSVNGAYYEASAASTAYVAPVITETTTVTEEYVVEKARTPVYRKKVAAKPRKKVWRAKAKPSCSCTCVCR